MMEGSREEGVHFPDAAPKYVAHISEDGERVESVETHLRQVAQLASSFAEDFGAASWAYAAGLAHDIGKFSPAFQRRILHDGPKVDHSTAGAAELSKYAAGMLSYCVAGHHGGLPNGGTILDDGGTLLGRLNAAERNAIPDYSSYRSEIALSCPDAPRFSVIPSDNESGAFSTSFMTRMVFSCLVDADFLCTEAFMNNAGRQGVEGDSLEVLRDRMEERLQSFYPPRTWVNEIRCSLLDDCLAASSQQPGVFSLTAPTGSGKTWGLLRFALNHACSQPKPMRRVICAIPYTSIIEQNAQEYRKVLGAENVLEHHSSFDYGESDDPKNLGYRLRLAAENWDAPVVVTTNVQLFESLYASKTSRCRKLHNIANSVILLDEAQMIPVKYLKPCVKALSELVNNYGCSVVLCTATQPCLDGFFAGEGHEVQEIAANPAALAKTLSRVRYQSDGAVADDSLAQSLLGQHQALCIVNSRKQARALYDMLAERNEDGVFHLTTMMHPLHRQEKIAEIKALLDADQRCIVVATCLVEAGVDFDFPVVYRAVSGVDSLVQAGGRCNREGKREKDDSIVHVFTPADDYVVPAEVEQRAAVAQSIMPSLLSVSDGYLEVEDAVSAYFNRLYKAKGERELDAKNVVPRMSQLDPRRAPRDGSPICIFPFSDVGNDFKLIEEGSFPLVIPCEENEGAIERARSGLLTRGDQRLLSRYTVSIYLNDLKALDEAGAIESLSASTYVLLDRRSYRNDVGLDIAREGGDALFC